MAGDEVRGVFPKKYIGVFLLFLCFWIVLLPPCVSAAMQLSEGENDLGLISYTEAPKTWTINLDNFQKVEVGIYNSARSSPSRYGGYMAYLKINGEKIWEHTGGSNIRDYVMGTTVSESAYRDQYYDLTSKFHSGENTITYYHYTGDGKHGIKVRLTKGATVTPSPAKTPSPTPTKTPTPTPTSLPVTQKLYCTGSTCGVIKTVQSNGVEVTGDLSDVQKDIVKRINRLMQAVDPIYGSRRVDETITVNIVPGGGSTPVWSESKNTMIVPEDASDIEIAHEVTHYMTFGLIYANGGNPENVPLWFREGVAEYAANQVTGTFADTYQERFQNELEKGSTKAEIDTIAKQALNEAKLIQPGGTTGLSSTDKIRFYGSSSLFVEFLYKTYGKDDIIITMVDSSKSSWWGGGETIDAILESRTGKSFAALEDNWLSYLDKNWHIYDVVEVGGTIAETSQAPQNPADTQAPVTRRATGGGAQQTQGTPAVGTIMPAETAVTGTDVLVVGDPVGNFLRSFFGWFWR